MSRVTITEAECVELNIWVATASRSGIADTSLVCPAKRTTPDSEDDEFFSEEEEEFADAPEHIDSDTDIETDTDTTNVAEIGFVQHTEVAESPQEEPIPDSTNRIWLKRSLYHNLNSIFITAGMLVGIIFAYFQYRQQAWSNQMATLQTLETCFTLEQASSSMANSSLCDKVLRENPSNARMHLFKRTVTTTPTRFVLPLLFVFVLIPIAINIYIIFRIWFRSALTGIDVQNDEHFSPLMHIPAGIARLDPELDDTDSLDKHKNHIHRELCQILTKEVRELEEEMASLRGERDALLQEREKLRHRAIIDEEWLQCFNTWDVDSVRRAFRTFWPERPSEAFVVVSNNEGKDVKPNPTPYRQGKAWERERAPSGPLVLPHVKDSRKRAVVVQEIPVMPERGRPRYVHIDRDRTRGMGRWR